MKRLADLANIVNESALRAVRMGRDAVTQEDLEASVENVIAGTERKSFVIPENEKRIVAYHEIGHALVAAHQKNAVPVQKITIIPRTSGALGYTMQVDEEEHVLMKREDILIEETYGVLLEEEDTAQCTCARDVANVVRARLHGDLPARHPEAAAGKVKPITRVEDIDAYAGHIVLSSALGPGAV